MMRAQQRYGTDKDAVILHCPCPMRIAGNPFHLHWDEAVQRCLSDDALRGRYAAIPGLTIVTYNNRPQEALLETCMRHLGYGGLVVLGRDVRTWSWRCKISLVHDYLRSGACTTPYILCLDGDDVLVIDDPTVLIDRFLATNSEVVFCGTRGNQPPSPECWDFENGVAEYADPVHRHLNAGCYLGRTPYVAARLAEILAAMDAGEPWCYDGGKVDDQLAWRHLHRRLYPEIKVDAACRLFLRFDEDR
ncbi:MAG: hypothetical protein JWM87_2661 [Candidatus Eremiobacteraeota bacterium]|nr:hypothetical protein [Candidatus Eremiobacteraeota bacterium]